MPKFDACQDNDLEMDQPDFGADPLEILIALEEADEIDNSPYVATLKIEFTISRKRRLVNGHH